MERQLLDQTSPEGANRGGGDREKDQLILQLQRENYEMRMREAQHASDYVRCITNFPPQRDLTSMTREVKLTLTDFLHALFALSKQSRASLSYSPTDISRHPLHSHSQSQSIASYSSGFPHNSASHASQPESPSSLSGASPTTGPTSNGSITSPYQDNSPSLAELQSTSQASGVPSSMFTFPPTTVLAPPRSLAQIYANYHHHTQQLYQYATLPMHAQCAHQQQPHDQGSPSTASTYYQPTQSQSQSQRYQAAMQVFEQKQQQNWNQEPSETRPRLSQVDTNMERSREDIVEESNGAAADMKFERLSKSGGSSPLVVD